MHAHMCKSMRLRHYWYVDLNAGDGNGCIQIAYDELKDTPLPWTIKGVEWGPQFRELKGRLGWHPDIDLVHGDNNSIGRHWASMVTPMHRGLVLHDPNCKIELPLLQSFATTPLDVLIYYTATNNKRVWSEYKKQQADPTRALTRRLHKPGMLVEDIINANIKQHWVIREPRGNGQWTFLFGSNWEKLSSFSWKRQGFYPLTSPEGRAIFAYINAPANKERKEAMMYALAQTQQLSLFGAYDGC